MHKAALSANPDTKILIDEPVTYGRLPTQPEINDMPVVKSLYKLVNNIDDEEWGNKTVDIKKQMMNAIYDWQLLACEQSRCFQQTADPNTTDTDNDKELFKWLAMSDYTADFKACVEGNTVWKIIVCNWVALCRPRNSIWHFCGGMLPKLFAKSRMSILTARIDGIGCRECEGDEESSDKD